MATRFLSIVLNLVMAALGGVAYAQDLTPEFEGPRSLGELQAALGPVSFQVHCPSALGLLSEDEATALGRQRTVKVRLARDTNQYQDPQILGGLLIAARAAVYKRCLILYPNGLGGFERATGGGAINILTRVGAQFLLAARVNEFSEDSFGTAHDYGAQREAAAAQARAVEEGRVAELTRQNQAALAAQQQQASEAVVQSGDSSTGAPITLTEVLQAFLVSLLIVAAWLAREEIALLWFELMPQPSPEPPASSFPTDEERISSMSDEKIVHLPMIRDEARSTVYDTDYLPPAPLGIEFLAKMRNRARQGTVASHTDLVLEVNRYLDARTQQVNAKAGLMRAEAEAVGLAEHLPLVREVAGFELEAQRNALRHQAAVRGKVERAELTEAELRIKIAEKAIADLDRAPIVSQPSECQVEELDGIFRRVREFEATCDIKIAQLIAENGGSGDALSEDALRHIDHLRVLKANIVADMYARFT